MHIHSSIAFSVRDSSVDDDGVKQSSPRCRLISTYLVGIPVTGREKACEFSNNQAIYQYYSPRMCLSHIKLVFGNYMIFLMIKF